MSRAFSQKPVQLLDRMVQVTCSLLRKALFGVMYFPSCLHLDNDGPHGNVSRPGTSVCSPLVVVVAVFFTFCPSASYIINQPANMACHWWKYPMYPTTSLSFLSVASTSHSQMAAPCNVRWPATAATPQTAPPSAPP